MGTRAVVAKVNDDNTMTGTYVGYDGDPAYALAEIIAIINRDGIEEALDTIITAHTGWRNISSTASDFVHEGYGEFYDDMVYPVTQPMDTEGKSDLFDMGGAHWAYVFNTETRLVDVWERIANWVFRETIYIDDFAGEEYNEIRKAFLKFSL